MKRPFLNEIPLTIARSGGLNILVGPGEWDAELQDAYNTGHTLIVFGPNELAVKAYRKVMNSQMELFTDRPGRKQGE